MKTLIYITYLLFFSVTIYAQNSVDTSKADPNVYPNEMSAGEFTPGKGFQIAKTKFASLNISMYAMARYVNQMPGTDTWTDHRDSVRVFDGRQDIHWHRNMIWFSGFLGTPRLTYTLTVWTVMTTQQTLLYGNLQYRFNKHFRAGIGVIPNPSIRTMQGPFPFFSSTDRTMGEEALRGGFTNGIFLSGEIIPRLNYMVMLGNNLSTLGVVSAKLTRNLSKGINLTWLPTTGEFGPRGGNGDFEHHEKIATRLGVNYSSSRENRFNNTGTPSPDNTQVRLSDGVLFFETGALASKTTVEEADYNLVSADLGLKYKGFALHTEFYHRTLSDFDVDGPVPISKITDKGYTIQALYMVVPKVLCVYGVYSGLADEFKRNPWEAGGGLNIYPIKSRSWRLNIQAMYINKSAGGGTFGLYNSGQTGTTLTIGTDILL